MPPKGHAILSASSSDRWLHCPPSARLCESYDDKGSDYAAEGTDAHALCEYKLRQALGMEVTDPTESLTWFNEEMSDCATGYAAYVLEQVEAAKQTCADPVVRIEQRVDFSRWVESGFGTIEARVIAWLAGEQWRQDVFAKGGDIYCASASQMFKVPVEKHGINGHLRQKGKIAELALGYGGSVGALKAMGALDMRLTEEELQPLVAAWRQSNPHIVQLWWDVDHAATEAVREKKSNVTHGIKFHCQSGMFFDSKGELLITIMSSIAQEESRSISENVRKRFADGKVFMPYKHFLGYCKGPDGLPQVVEKEAAVVRSIYLMFLEGHAPTYIAKALTEKGIPTPSGKTQWSCSSVESILTNEKYKGDALLQKKFTVDFLTKTMKQNEGEVPQYYVTDSHEGIISPEVFELAQYEYQRRREKGGYQSHSASPFSGHIICGECGAYYDHKVWHSNDKYRRLVWYCNKRYGKGAGDGLKCKTPHLTDDEVKVVFVGAMNAALTNKQEILNSCRTAVQFLTDTSGLEAELSALEAEREVTAELLRKCIDENAHAEISQEDYETKYAVLAEKYETLKGKCNSVNDRILRRRLKANRIEAFFKTMESSDLITEFNEGFWNATVDTMTIYSRKRIVLLLKDGTEIEWHI